VMLNTVQLPKPLEVDTVAPLSFMVPESSAAHWPVSRAVDGS
jgi:hypothetical protein